MLHGNYMGSLDGGVDIESPSPPTIPLATWNPFPHATLLQNYSDPFSDQSALHSDAIINRGCSGVWDGWRNFHCGQQATSENVEAGYFQLIID